MTRPKNFKNRKYTAKVGQDNVNIGVVTSGSGVVLYKVLFCFLVNKFIVEHAFNVFSNSFLYHGSLVLGLFLLFVEGWVIKLSDLSIITVADPLSADLIIMSCLCLS